MWSSEHLASLRAVHILGHLNGGANMLYRAGSQVREWRLCLRKIAQIWDRFGKTEPGASGGSSTDSGGTLLANKDVVRRNHGATVGTPWCLSLWNGLLSHAGSQILHSQPGLWSLWANPLRGLNPMAAGFPINVVATILGHHRQQSFMCEPPFELLASLNLRMLSYKWLLAIPHASSSHWMGESGVAFECSVNT